MAAVGSGVLAISTRDTFRLMVGESGFRFFALTFELITYRLIGVVEAGKLSVDFTPEWSSRTILAGALAAPSGFLSALGRRPLIPWKGTFEAPGTAAFDRSDGIYHLWS